MKTMTTHERMTCVYDHREPDRVPITDGAWESTVTRWQGEGMPKDISWERYFGLDHIIFLGLDDIDTSPRFEARVIEETNTYRIEADRWGATKKNFKPESSTPLYLDFIVHDTETWRKVKPRMTPARDRVNWDRLRWEYKTWRREGAWIIVAPWFGFDITHARFCGTETVLSAMALEPGWVLDIFDTGCELALALLDMIWEEGYTFDEFLWYDDMGYRSGMLFSKKMWREMVKPYQQRVIDWAHAHGIKAHLHCCGNIMSLVSDLIDMGLDALNPLEVKAGMHPIALKKAYGENLVLRGGFSAVDWASWEKVEADIRTTLPVMMESGGYVFSSDHSIPDYTSLDTYQRIVKLAKELGTY